MTSTFVTSAALKSMSKPPRRGPAPSPITRTGAREFCSSSAKAWEGVDVHLPKSAHLVSNNIEELKLSSLIPEKKK